MTLSDRPRSRLSVVVVSDYEANEEKTWKDEEQVLKSLADQDIDGSFNIILVENNNAESSVPSDLYQKYPLLKIIFTDESQSAKLKDHGVKHAETEYVAVIEADCLPNREWLRVLYETLHQQKDFSVVSGRTTYGIKRCISAVSALWTARLITWATQGKHRMSQITEPSTGALC